MKVGQTLESFHSVGTFPECKEWLKMDARCDEIEGAQPFRTLLEMPSGPEATTDLIPAIPFMTSVPVTSRVDKPGESAASAGSAGIGVRQVKFLTKVALNKLALPSGVVAELEPSVTEDGTRL